MPDLGLMFIAIALLCVRSGQDLTGHENYVIFTERIDLRLTWQRCKSIQSCIQVTCVIGGGGCHQENNLYTLKLATIDLCYN